MKFTIRILRLVITTAALTIVSTSHPVAELSAAEAPNPRIVYNVQTLSTRADPQH